MDTLFLMLCSPFDLSCTVEVVAGQVVSVSLSSSEK